MRKTHMDLSFLLEQSGVSSQPNMTDPAGIEVCPLNIIVNQAGGLKLLCQSTNHNAGHQTAAGSLLMYSCDSACVVTVLLLFLIWLCVDKRRTWNLLTCTVACVFECALCVVEEQAGPVSCRKEPRKEVKMRLRWILTQSFRIGTESLHVGKRKITQVEKMSCKI